MQNKPNISLLSNDECCGCKACGDVCPKNCITFSDNIEGFSVPTIDEDVCIHCGRCVTACPVLSPSGHEIAESVYATYAKDDTDRRAGSSGGIFGLIAKHIIGEDGVVYGAAFDNSLKLHHVKASTLDELRPLLRSKYLQSDTAGVYNDILDELRHGTKVLFSGTPCQCNALLNAGGAKYDNLLTVEVICHGVPSQKFFDDCITYQEKKTGRHIISFTFRSKYDKALHPHAFTIISEKNGKLQTRNGLHYQTPFYFGFQKYITLRRSCYSCRQARPQRSADLTLGDFWGIEKFNSSLDAKQGVSMVIANTDKGHAIIGSLREAGLIWTQSFPIHVALENNGNLVHPIRLSPEREKFFSALAKEPFDNVVKHFLTPRRKWIFDLYYGMPSVLRKIIRKIMDKHMRYE